MITFKKFDLSDYKDCLIVTDKKIAEIYSIYGSNVYLLPQGEQAKSFRQVHDLCQWFLIRNLNKGGNVVAIGGGSIGDTVGFACSIYKRGSVRLTHIPTTLLAQIDSSIGGKTALDINGVKNAVGTFFKADTVIDVNFLKTLDVKQTKSGMGELIKYRMLSDDVNGKFNGEVTEQVIKSCVEFKQSVCELDPFDQNVRKKLNFGHTLGHSMEIDHDLQHGFAVANGMYYETKLAYKLNKCSKEYCEHWTKVIADMFKILPIDVSDVMLSQHDKKNSDNGICFVLPDNFDETYLTLEQVLDILC